MPIGDLILRLRTRADTRETDEALDDTQRKFNETAQAGEEAGGRMQSAMTAVSTTVSAVSDSLDRILAAVERLAAWEAEQHGIATAQAGDVQLARQIQGAFQLENIGDADALRRSLAGRGLSESTIRGFFDPIQEYVAAATLDPTDITANRNREYLGQLFDLDAISQGGAANLDLLLSQVAGLTPQQQSFLPAAGVSINDVQELVPYARDFTAGGGLGGLRARFPGLLTEERAAATFGAADTASAYYARQDRFDAIQAGIVAPENLYERGLTTPFTADALRLADDAGLTRRARIDYAAIEEAGLRFTINIDGQPILEMVNREAEQGGLSYTDPYSAGN